MSVEKKTFKDILFKDAITTGIISSIIFTFLLQPFIPLAWAYLRDSGLQVYTDFSNQIFLAAALGYRNDVERIFSSILTVVLLILTSSAVFFFIFDVKGFNSMREFVGNEKVSSFLKRKTTMLGLRVLEVILILLFVWMTFQTVLNTTLIYASTELNASFHQKLNALGPFLSDQDAKSLLSAWALMKNENDYNQINGRLEKIAGENNIELPKTLWPDVLSSYYAWP